MVVDKLSSYSDETTAMLTLGYLYQNNVTQVTLYFIFAPKISLNII